MGVHYERLPLSWTWGGGGTWKCPEAWAPSTLLVTDEDAPLSPPYCQAVLGPPWLLASPLLVRHERAPVCTAG